MKTLFSKILLWFLATAAVASLGSVIVIAVVDSTTSRGYEPHLRLLRFHGGEAVRAYEQGGSPALADFLDRIEAVYQFRALLADADGRPLSGPPQDLAPLVDRARRSRWFPDRARRALVLAAPIEAGDRSYWFFLLLPRDHFGFWARLQHSLLLPHLWIVACVLLLSYALARHLTRPVLQLRDAADRLGCGELSARVGSSRRDELGQLARSFDHMAGRLERSITSQQQLLEDVSHELRSPLSRLAVAVELARSDPSQLDRVSREADRLNVLVSDLLALSHDQPRPEPLDLSDLLAALVGELQIEAQCRPCRLALDCPPDLSVFADPELLRRAFENVVRNALRYTVPDTEVRLTARRRDSRLEIEVQDSGPGVPEETLPRLFEPFYRVHPDRDRSTGGVGLGLAIARRAVELHKGRITARNAHPGLEVQIAFRAA